MPTETLAEFLKRGGLKLTLSLANTDDLRKVAMKLTEKKLVWKTNDQEDITPRPSTKPTALLTPRDIVMESAETNANAAPAPCFLTLSLAPPALYQHMLLLLTLYLMVFKDHILLQLRMNAHHAQMTR